MEELCATPVATQQGTAVPEIGALPTPRASRSQGSLNLTVGRHQKFGTVTQVASPPVRNAASKQNTKSLAKEEKIVINLIEGKVSTIERSTLKMLSLNACL